MEALGATSHKAFRSLCVALVLFRRGSYFAIRLCFGRKVLMIEEIGGIR